ncbi:MAG: 2-oxoacid:acceptor oxidoreductase family protein [Nitrospirota bacterium]
MVRIRFHGRGGQGAKTAARLVATAAFLEGWMAQDSPLYGAERRGAPMTAFARLDRAPIRERGMIARPDLVVVADDSLLADPAAHVGDGVEADTVVFVNSEQAVTQLLERAPCPGRLLTGDLTGLVLAQLGKAGALSGPLGAVAARLVGLSETNLRTALVMELGELGLPVPVIEQNLSMAHACFELVQPVPLRQNGDRPGQPASLRTPTYEPPTSGTARISALANVTVRKTGGWRTFRPVLDPEKCIGCWMCYLHCPDGAVRMTGATHPLIDYDHCKGCLLCVEECPTLALISEREAGLVRRSS